MKRVTPFILVLWAAIVWCSSSPLRAEEEKPGTQSATAGKADSGNAPRLLAAARENSATPAAAGPKIVFPEPVHDFGTVTRGASVSHDFKVRNEGSAPLELVGAKGG